MRRVYITGVGVVSSIGLGRRAFFDALGKGASGISQVESFDAAPLGRTFAGEVKGFRAEDHLSNAELRRVGRCSAMSLAAMRMAIEDAGIGADALRGPRTSVVVGTTMGEADVIADLDHAWIAGGFRAMRRAMMPKYGSTLLPIHLALVIGGAAEILQELQFSGFVRLSAMAPQRCQPFDLNRQGLILGEGAGIMVLESEEHATRRGANVQAEVGG